MNINTRKKLIFQLILFIVGVLILSGTAIMLFLNIFFNKNISIIIIFSGFVISNICLFLASKNQNKQKNK
jgi:positive regulator of sigma E activity